MFFHNSCIIVMIVLKSEGALSFLSAEFIKKMIQEESIMNKSRLEHVLNHMKQEGIPR